MMTNDQNTRMLTALPLTLFWHYINNKGYQWLWEKSISDDRLVHGTAVCEKRGLYIPKTVSLCCFFLFFWICSLCHLFYTFRRLPQLFLFPVPCLKYFLFLSFWSTQTSSTLLNSSLSYLIAKKYSSNCLPIHSVKGRYLQMGNNNIYQ